MPLIIATLVGLTGFIAGGSVTSGDAAKYAQYLRGPVVTHHTPWLSLKVKKNLATYPIPGGAQ